MIVVFIRGGFGHKGRTSCEEDYKPRIAGNHQKLVEWYETGSSLEPPDTLHTHIDLGLVSPKLSEDKFPLFKDT